MAASNVIRNNNKNTDMTTLTHWYSKDVGQELKKKLVSGHSSIHTNFLQLTLGRILVHALQHLNTHTHTHIHIFNTFS